MFYLLKPNIKIYHILVSKMNLKMRKKTLELFSILKFTQVDDK